MTEPVRPYAWTPDGGKVPPSARPEGPGLGCAVLLALVVLAFVIICVVAIGDSL